MTTCPSGVNYMHLIDHGRSHIEKTYKRPFSDRFIRDFLSIALYLNQLILKLLQF